MHSRSTTATASECARHLSILRHCTVDKWHCTRHRGERRRVHTHWQRQLFIGSYRTMTLYRVRPVEKGKGNEVKLTIQWNACVCAREREREENPCKFVPVSCPCSTSASVYFGVTHETPSIRSSDLLLSHSLFLRASLCSHLSHHYAVDRYNLFTHAK